MDPAGAGTGGCAASVGWASRGSVTAPTERPRAPLPTSVGAQRVVVPLPTRHHARMALFQPVESIAQNIQLAVAPVFLLTAIGTFVNVLAGRIARVVDRARRLEADFQSFDFATRAEARRELAILDRRMRTVNTAIGLCTLSALLVCTVVAILFVGEIYPMRWTQAVALLFIAAMALLIAGLVLFLHEVQIALRSLRVKAHLLAGDAVDRPSPDRLPDQPASPTKRLP